MGDIEILGMPISLGTMIYQAIIFTVLIFLLKNKFMGKIVEAMENRRESIENELKLAETYKLDAENNMMKQREITEEALKQAKEIIAKGRQEASNVVKEARKDALLIRTQAHEESRAKKVQGVRGAS